MIEASLIKQNISALIFDIGDVIYDASPWRKWLTNALRAQGLEITYGELVARWEELLVDVYLARASYWDKFQELLESCGLSPSKTMLVMEASRTRQDALQARHQAFPEVIPTLQALHDRGVRIVALSDTQSGAATVQASLDRLGVGAFFDAVVTSYDCGHVKPEPEAFQCALAAAGLPREACAFVGHDIDELDGAIAFGLYAIAYNFHPDARADYYLAHFGELLELAGGVRRP